jgi:hypothetical protein
LAKVPQVMTTMFNKHFSGQNRIITVANWPEKVKPNLMILDKNWDCHILETFSIIFERINSLYLPVKC